MCASRDRPPGKLHSHSQFLKFLYIFVFFTWSVHPAKIWTNFVELSSLFSQGNDRETRAEVVVQSKMSHSLAEEKSLNHEKQASLFCGK
jgi:hypothetical protein